MIARTGDRSVLLPAKERPSGNLCHIEEEVRQVFLKVISQANGIYWNAGVLFAQLVYFLCELPVEVLRFLAGGLTVGKQENRIDGCQAVGRLQGANQSFDRV